jgi:hypothetical protein
MKALLSQSVRAVKASTDVPYVSRDLPEEYGMTALLRLPAVPIWPRLFHWGKYLERETLAGFQCVAGGIYERREYGADS